MFQFNKELLYYQINEVLPNSRQGFLEELNKVNYLNFNLDFQIFNDPSFYDNSENFSKIHLIINPGALVYIKNFLSFDGIYEKFQMDHIYALFKNPKFKNNAFQVKKGEMFKTGLEIYKQKQDIVKSFCVNHYLGIHNEFIVLNGK